MSIRFSRMTVLAAAVGLLLSGPLPAAQDAQDDKVACAALRHSALAAPEWYSERCEGVAIPDALSPDFDPSFVPGDTVYLCSLFSATPALARRLLTAPLPTSTYTNVGECSVAPRSIFAMDFDNAASVLWAIDSQCAAACTGTAYGTINQTTGVFTQVGNITGAPAGANFAGLRFDPTSSNVYIMALTSAGGFQSQLMTLDLTNGVATPVGPPSTRLIIDIGISNTGVIYGHDIVADQIVTHDRTTGAVTLVGNTGIDANFAQGMDFDASDNTLYLFALTIPGNVGRIGSVNLATGAFTQLSQNTEELEAGIDVQACTPAAVPTGTTATATAPNQITVTWNAVAGATGYNVYRAAGACPQTSYTLIAPNVQGTTYVDNGLSGGSTFAYVVTSLAGSCESARSNCDDATATGGCTIPPTFAGLTSATSAGTTNCAIDLAWSAATNSCPGTTVKYNVYRSTTSGTPPSPATLIQSCVTGLTYRDNGVTAGTRYYYIVRAEDSQTGGTGACNNGFQDANVVERSAVPGGPSATVTDNVESGNLYWSTAGGTGTNLWNIVTTNSNSPTHSWFVADPAIVTDQRLTTTNPGNIPAGFTMSFFHRFDTESTTGTTGYDGHVLEYSLDGGTTWTDILAGQGTIPANPARFTLNGYNRTISTVFMNPLGGRQAWSGDNGAFQEVRVDMADFSGRDVSLRIRFASDNSVSDVGVWVDDITYRFPGTCTTVPDQAAAPEALAVDTSGNLVYQPNETVVVAPTWRNTGAQAITLTGALTNHTGPAGPTYEIPDGAASYGTIGVGTTANCGSNCYAVRNTVTVRPATHWDSTALETVTPTSATKTWTLHIGDSFTDVPPTNPFYRFIETILHKNVTGGCTTDLYCPFASTTREVIAVFVLVAKEPPGYSPVACGATPMFADVPVTSPFCKWIEELARRGVVTGCAPNLYCPTAEVTREQMAVIVLRTLDPTMNPPPCTAGSEVFNDVPASSGFCRWIEELFRRGVVSGCGGGNYCPTAAVTREQMSVFLAVTFGITLYGL